MNNIDRQYQALLQDILDNGYTKKDRTGTGTISVFGRQIRHKMSEGFPLLTTKKMYFNGIVTELIWFLRGDTNIKYLVDNDCHIWDGDAYKNYENAFKTRIDDTDSSDVKSYNYIEPNLSGSEYPDVELFSKQEFIEKIKTDPEFAKKWGELGPLYGHQWRKWGYNKRSEYVFNGKDGFIFADITTPGKDQIADAIHKLKTNPDDRGIIVSAWNVGELDKMVLRPCHNFFQFYTRELTFEERWDFAIKYGCVNSDAKMPPVDSIYMGVNERDTMISMWNDPVLNMNIPKRAISLMWNQRSVDTFLGLPFNIASYALLLEIIAKEVNMIPDELIGSLGDVHLYSNHIEQAKEQIGREPMELPKLKLTGWLGAMTGNQIREEGFLNLIETQLLPTHFRLENYQSHPAIKAPLSN